jgi:hypothetical protein
VLSGLQITASDSPFGIFKLLLSFFCWLLCCLTFKLRLLGQEKLEDHKGVIRSHNSKASKHNNQKKKDKKSLKMPKGLSEAVIEGQATQ